MDFKEFDTFTLNIAQCQSLLFRFLNNIYTIRETLMFSNVQIRIFI